MDSRINLPTSVEINDLFLNNSPDIVWNKGLGIATRINPDFNPTFAKTVFDDVIRVFKGEHPDYCTVKTLYHDLPHTLDVFLCAMRLLHGLHISGRHISGEDITLVIIASLMHDIGYVQSLEEENGTGAQFTQCHVARGIKFMRLYLLNNAFPLNWAEQLEPMLLSSDHAFVFSQINFPDERIRLLAKVVATADLVGQMADRVYLEKLLFLYLEFKEAHLGNFKNIHDMLFQTKQFYEVIRTKLDEELCSLYHKLTFHFNDTFGVENNYYMEAIEKNIAYLSEILSLDEAQRLAMLKRSGIVAKTQLQVLDE